jgi:hypothetical protein
MITNCLTNFETAQPSALHSPREPDSRKDDQAGWKDHDVLNILAFAAIIVENQPMPIKSDGLFVQLDSTGVQLKGAFKSCP